MDAVRELLDVGGTTLGGARPKASVIDGDGALSIAKFPHPGAEWDVLAWEKTALDLAERAGLDVPHDI
jgi:serine/threonine-protein kinase HipA